MNSTTNNLPGGTVTFLFTDIEGSTKRWEQHPDAMWPALRRHDMLLKEAIESNGGHVFKTVGDAFCAAFVVPGEALQAALAAQKAIQLEEWGEQIGGMRVRMALHSGVAELQDGDYFGPPLNRVARLLSAGYGEQILLSEAMYGLVRDSLPDKVSVLDLGEHRLKDLARPEHVFQVTAPSIPRDFPALKTLDNRPNNLPLQPTPFVGREKEIADVAGHLRQSDVRLLTLTGPGGMGKTRLALQVAADMIDEQQDGTFFVDLSPITDPDLLVSEIAHALGVRETPGVPLLECLKDHLRVKYMLLVLDNFEQVVESASLVAELLSAAPGIKMLVTSRILLHVRGERNFPVPPLGMPNPKQLPSFERITQYEAVRLFVARAIALKPDFEITSSTAPAIAEICYRLDGLPLAIELAAARIRMLPPQAMLSRLQGRLKLLTGGHRDLPLRQQTLRNAIEWSYDLLAEDEKQLFRRLTVFVGSISFEAIESVCNTDSDLDIDVLDGVESLVNKSLLRQVERADGEPSFSMLQTIHEFGLEQLMGCGEYPQLREQHATYYLSLAEMAEQEMRGHDQEVWLERLDEALDNIRLAVGWSQERAEWENLGRLSSALWRFMLTYGYLREGSQWLGTSLQGHVAPALRAKLLNAAGIFAHEQGDYAKAQDYFHESLEINRQVGDRQAVASSLNNLGMFAYHQDDYAHATELFEESLALRKELGDTNGISVSLNNLGSIAHRTGDYTRAAQLYNESLAIERKLGDKQGIAAALSNLGEVLLDLGDHEQANAHYLESLQLCQELGDKQGITVCLDGLGGAAGKRGHFEHTARLLGAADALRQSIDCRVQPSYQPTYDRIVGSVRSQIGDAEWTRLHVEGEAMAWDEAYDYAVHVGSLEPISLSLS